MRLADEGMGGLGIVAVAMIAIHGLLVGLAWVGPAVGKRLRRRRPDYAAARTRDVINNGRADTAARYRPRGSSRPSRGRPHGQTVVTALRSGLARPAGRGSRVRSNLGRASYGRTVISTIARVVPPEPVTTSVATNTPSRE